MKRIFLSIVSSAFFVSACSNGGDIAAPGGDVQSDGDIRKSCGNGVCSGAETCSSCPSDCGPCGLDAGAADAAAPTDAAGGSDGAAVDGGSTVANVRDVTQYGARGDNVTDDTAAINAAITALGPRDELYFPCGTYKISSALRTIAVQGVTVAGAPGCATIHGTGSGYTILRVGGGGLSAATPLLATAAELATSFSADPAALGGLAAGDYVALQEGGKDYSTDTSPGHDTLCDVSGCRGEVLRVQSVSGQTITVTTALHDRYEPVINAARVQKVTGRLDGAQVHDLTFDGSGTLSAGLEMVAVTSSSVQTVNGRGFVNSALASYYSFGLSFTNITVTHSGSGGAGAFKLFLQGRPSMSAVSLNNLNANAFGLGLSTLADGTFTNLTIDSAGVTIGRPFKTCAASYNRFDNLTVRNGPSAYNGISIEYYSSHNTFNACVVTGNQSCNGCGGAGINSFGNFDRYNTFNNCTVTGNGNVQVSVGSFDALHLGQDSFLTINGGTYTGTQSAEQVLIIEGASPSIHGATIGGSGSVGLYLDAHATGACINNNTFLAGGLGSAIQVSSTSDIGSGNVLGGLASNLTPGVCP